MREVDKIEFYRWNSNYTQIKAENILRIKMFQFGLGNQSIWGNGEIKKIKSLNIECELSSALF